jgi:hypothetical protein
MTLAKFEAAWAVAGVCEAGVTDAVDNPFHHGVQVCQDLQVNAGGFGFGGAHTRIVLGTRGRSRTTINVIEQQA